VCSNSSSTVTFQDGWWYTYHLEKYEFVSRDDEIPIYYGKIKKCSKPPTRSLFRDTRIPIQV